VIVLKTDTDMNRTRVKPQESKNIPQIGSQLPVEERLKIIANLIIDRILEKQQLANNIKQP
jgi:hypothetical protein